MSIDLRWIALPLALVQTGCSLNKQMWTCQSMLSRSQIDYSSMKLERNLLAVAFSVSIEAGKIKLGGYTEQGDITIRNSCEKLPDETTYACRDGDTINIGNIGNQKFHNFSLNTETGIFSYGNVKRNNLESTQGVCSPVK
jgi:hypothetical protein